MRESTVASGLIRRLPAGKLAVLTGIAAGAALLVPSAAMAATTDPVTIAVAYTSPAVNPGAPDTVVYSVKNSGTATSYVNFSDELPGGVTLDDLPSETWGTGCGTNNDVNNAGAGAVTIANLEVAAKATCTVSFSVDIAATAVGKTESDTLTALSWAASDGGAATAAAYLANDETTPTPLAVVADPTIAISGVKNGAKYSYGQLVAVRYTTAAASGDAIVSSAAYDDAGDTLNSGSYIDTLEPGAHSVSVEVNSQDGASVTDTVNYTVTGPALTKLSSSVKRDTVSFKIALPWAGRLSAKLLDGKKVVGTAATATIKGKTTTSVKVALDAAGKKLLKHSGKHGLKLTAEATYTPSRSVASSWPTTAAANGYTPGKVTASAVTTLK